MSRIAIFVFIISNAFAATENGLGPLFGFQKEFEIRLSDCSAVWKVGPSTAGCEVHLFDRPQAFLVSPTMTLSYWKYREDEGWEISVSIQREVYGYSIQLRGIREPPQDRFQFPIAKKYILAALQEGQMPSEKSPYSSQLISLKPNRSDGFTPLRFKKRSLDFKSEEFVKELYKRLLPQTEEKKVVLIQFAKYFLGEMIWSQARFEGQANVEKAGGLKISFGAFPVWQLLGASSLAYLRLEYSAEMKYATFSELYKEAVRSIPVQNFSVIVQTTKSTDNVILKEEDLGLVYLMERKITFDYETCEKTWAQEDERGRCRVDLNWPLSRRMGANKSIIDTQILIGDKSAYLVVTADDKGYWLQVFAEKELLSSFQKVKNFVEKAIGKKPMKDLSIRTFE